MVERVPVREVRRSLPVRMGGVSTQSWEYQGGDSGSPRRVGVGVFRLGSVETIHGGSGKIQDQWGRIEIR